MGLPIAVHSASTRLGERHLGERSVQLTDAEPAIVLSRFSHHEKIQMNEFQGLDFGLHEQTDLYEL